MTTVDLHTSNGQAMTAQHIVRRSQNRWVPIAQTRVVPAGEGQRAIKKQFLNELIRDFDLDKIGWPVVSLRDGWYWIIDGQHRIAAMKAIGWGDQLVECEVFDGLTEAEEAAMFLARQNRIAVKPIEEFGAALKAGFPVEREIERVVRAQGLFVAGHAAEGSIRAVATLRKIYDLGGSEMLGKTLRIIRDAFGTMGLSAAIIEGIGLVCIRYQDKVNEQAATRKLSKTLGGVNGLLNRAAGIQKQTGRLKSHCVAAATIDLLNSGQRGRGALASWWREIDESEQ